MGIAACILVALSVALLIFTARLREDTLAHKTSLSDQVISTLPPPPVAEDDELGNGPTNTDLEDVDSSTIVTGTPLRLKRVPTREEAITAFERLHGKKQWHDKANVWFLAGIEPLIAKLSEVEGRELLWSVGHEASRSGDLETAQIYLREAYGAYVNASGRLHRRHYERIAGTAIRLAWLENNPEVAVRLLEKACSVDSPFQPARIALAAQLAEVTGSEELRDYYLSRSHEVLPE